MGFRIRKSFKLGPLGRVNLGRKGASFSFAVPGARMNFGTRGARLTTGIPGTGISYTTRLGGGGGGTMQRTSGAGGCLHAIFAISVVGAAIGIVVGIGVAAQSAVASVVVTVLMLGAWFFIARAIRKGKEARERAAYEEQQRQAAAYHAEQHRLQVEYHMEQQRQHALYQAEQERIAVLRAREAAEREAERARVASELEAEQARLRQVRWEALLAKYGDADAQRIWAGRPWIGCTYGMLVDMLGPPVDLDEKVLKTKTKHTYKYRQLGVNRFGLRVYLDDGVVTGWDDKNE